MTGSTRILTQELSTRLLLAVLAFGFTACVNPLAPAEDDIGLSVIESNHRPGARGGVAENLVIVQGNGQSGLAGATLLVAPKVQVQDYLGNGVGQAVLAFTVSSGGGTVGSASVTTDSTGFASTSWTLGSAAGANTMTVSLAGGSSSVTFSATALSTQTAAQLTISDGATYSYGTIAAGVSVDHTFTVSYSGDSSATSVVSSGLSAPLSFKGGTYPGTGGTCGATISADCTVVVTFSPSSASVESQTLNLAFNDGTTTQNATRAIQGTGVTTCGSLPANCPFEMGPGSPTFYGDLFAYWKLNNSWVDSIGAITATAIGNAGFTTAARIGSHAGTWDGTGDASNLGVLGTFGSQRALGFSITFWMKTSQTTIGAVLGIEEYGGGDPSNNMTLRVNALSDGMTNVQGTILFRMSAWDGSYEFISGTEMNIGINDGAWHHVAVTFIPSPGTMEMYVDGTALTTWPGPGNAIPGDFVDFTLPAYLGANNHAGVLEHAFNGQLDDFALWNRALTPAEVLQVYSP